MRRITWWFILAVLFSIVGCSIIPSFHGGDTSGATNQQLPDGNGSLSPTLTPFQPARPGASAIPLSTKQATATIQPTPTQALTHEGYISLGLPRPEGQVNILLLGSDWRPGAGFRTDVMLLLSLNPLQNQVTLFSFPRDLYVYIPGFGYERINTTQAKGGFNLTAETLLYNFDVPVDYYMMTNFYRFQNIIDALGGISLYAAYDLYDRCDLPQASNKMCYIPAGLHRMDGATALWYVRSRYSTSDFDRTRRAQEVALAMAQRAISLDAMYRAPELYNLFVSSVETNVPLDLVIKHLPLAVDALSNPERVQRFAITQQHVSSYTVPETGARVFIPDYDAIAEIIRNAIYP